MLVTESRGGRRLVGRLDRGVDLFPALLDLCARRKVRTGELRALGSLELVEVAEYDQARKSWKPSRTFAGGLEVLSLTGNVSERDGQLALHAHASLMRDRDNGVEVLGGHLVSARVFALEFVLEAFDDILLRRAPDPSTGLVLWHEALALDHPTPAPPVNVPVPAPAPENPAGPPSASPFEPTPQTSWHDVAAASARKAAVSPPADDSDEEDDTMQVGDIVMHPTFGRCQVQRVEGNYEYVHLRLRNGRLVRVSLDIIKVSRAGTEDGHRVFRARVE